LRILNGLFRIIENLSQTEMAKLEILPTPPWATSPPNPSRTVMAAVFPKILIEGFMIKPMNAITRDTRTWGDRFSPDLNRRWLH